MICSLKLLSSRMDGVVITHPCEVCADLQLRQRLSDVVAQLCGGGVWLLVVTARVTEGAVDAGPDQAQVEAEFPSSLLEDLQPHAGILQSLLGFSHGWMTQQHSLSDIKNRIITQVIMSNIFLFLKIKADSIKLLTYYDDFILSGGIMWNF